VRVLITGVGGWTGGHLARYLLQMGHEVHGLIHKREPKGLKEVRFHRCDLTEAHRVKEVIRAASPDCLFHLAAIRTAEPGQRWALFAVNVGGTLNVLEGVKALEKGCRVVVVGSSAAYGLIPPHENPIKEGTPFRPVTIYGVSKAVQDLLCYQYWASYSLAILRVRTFNQTGPGEREGLVCADLAKQVAEAELGLREPVLRVGNTKPRRDFTDVRDVVRGYWLVCQGGEPGQAYNLCSGQAHAVQEVVDILLSLSRVPLKVEVEARRRRRDEIPLQIGDYSKLREATGWSPRIPFRQSLADLLEYWREKVRQGV